MANNKNFTYMVVFVGKTGYNDTHLCNANTPEEAYWSAVFTHGKMITGVSIFTVQKCEFTEPEPK